MFDFVQSHIAPGERVEDNHHYGVQIYNPAAQEGRVRFQIGSAEVFLRVPPDAVVTIHDEESQHIIVENLSEHWLQAEWKKTRD